jgi:hypothetical protein
MKIIFDHLHGHIKDNRVFCEVFVIPEEETEEELLGLGFLPNVQPPIYWYQAKSCRINNEKVVLSHKRRKLLSRLLRGQRRSRFFFLPIYGAEKFRFQELLRQKL